MRRLNYTTTDLKEEEVITHSFKKKDQFVVNCYREDKVTEVCNLTLGYQRSGFMDNMGSRPDNCRGTTALSEKGESNQIALLAV